MIIFLMKYTSNIHRTYKLAQSIFRPVEESLQSTIVQPIAIQTKISTISTSKAFIHAYLKHKPTNVGRIALERKARL